MKSLTISEFRSDIAEAIKSLPKSPIAISRHGEDVAILMSVSLYEKAIAAMEDLEDLEIYDEVISSKEKFIPLKEVMKDLGI